jgi:hypothetical protein
MPLVEETRMLPTGGSGISGNNTATRWSDGSAMSQREGTNDLNASIRDNTLQQKKDPDVLWYRRGTVLPALFKRLNASPLCSLTESTLPESKKSHQKLRSHNAWFFFYSTSGPPAPPFSKYTLI